MERKKENAAAKDAGAGVSGIKTCIVPSKRRCNCRRRRRRRRRRRLRTNEENRCLVIVGSLDRMRVGVVCRVGGAHQRVGMCGVV